MYRPENVGERRLLESLGHWHVEFLGVSGTVMKMAASGWAINHEYDIARMASRFAFRMSNAPDSCGFILVSAPIDQHDLLEGRPGFMLIQRVLADNDRIRVYPTMTVSYHKESDPLSLVEPAFQDLRAAEYYGFVNKTPQGIIVAEDNVQAVLDAIRMYQAPIQQDIRKRQASTWAGQEKVAAQIIAV